MPSEKFTARTWMGYSMPRGSGPLGPRSKARWNPIRIRLMRDTPAVLLPESDACLVVVAVFKTAAPTLRAGG